MYLSRLHVTTLADSCLRFGGSSPTPPFLLHGIESRSVAASSPILVAPYKITVALCIAAFILIATGISYTLIGIKNKKLHIFFSAAYLTSLAVTVLVIFVVNPPISDAVQGAYLVAIVLPGLILGYASLLVTEFAEGLGCLLGGFCMSMWILALRPGGLITNHAAKIIFISCLTAGAFGLSLSRWTRDYALIVSTSFGGSTTIVIGIDCFSRAGLKESWLYIWALNNKMFPPTVTSYPISRGMKAEIALVVVISLGGIISQIKLWNTVKDRRKERNAESLENEMQMQEVDEAWGRNVEEGNQNDRAQWELIYGDKRKGTTRSRFDPSVEETISQNKNSASIVETTEVGSSTDGIEASSPKVPTKDLQDSLSVLLGAMGTGSSVAEHYHNIPHELPGSAPPLIARPAPSSRSSTIVSPTKVPRRKPVPSLSAGSIGSQQGIGEDAPTATVSDLESGLVRNPSTTSGHSFLRRFSGKKKRQNSRAKRTPLSDRGLSRTSSLAATPDPNSDGEGTNTPLHELLETVGSDPDSESHYSQTGLSLESRQGNGNKEQSKMLTHHGPEQARSPSPTLPPPNAGERSHTYSLPQEAVQFTHLIRSQSGEIHQDGHQDSKIESETQDQALFQEWFAEPRSKQAGQKLVQEALTASAVAQLPRPNVKIISSYRTNEWTKGLPTPEEAKIDALSGKRKSVEDIANETELLTLSTTPSESQDTPQRSRSPVRLELKEIILERSTPRNSNELNQEQRKFSLKPSSSKPSWSPSPQSSSSSLRSQKRSPRGIRTSSLPVFDQTLVDSPIEEGEVAVYPSPVIQTPPSLGPIQFEQRHNRIRKDKHSTTSLTNAPRSSAASPIISNDTRRFSTEANDTVSRSVRRSFTDLPYQPQQLHQQQQKSPQQPRQRAASHEIPRLSSDNIFFDSHQPKPARGSNPIQPQKRVTMLSEWKQSLENDRVAAQELATTVDTRRAELIRDKQQSRQKNAWSAKYRDSVLEQSMRRGELEHLHREAMRRMQAGANKYL